MFKERKDLYIQKQKKKQFNKKREEPKQTCDLQK